MRLLAFLLDPPKDPMNASRISTPNAAARGALMFCASRLGIGQANALFAPVHTGI